MSSESPNFQMANQRECCPPRRFKIAMAGSGMIGSTLGCLSALHGISDIVLVDVVPNMPMGKALELSHLLPMIGTNISLSGSNSYEAIKGADVVIVTAGLTKAPAKSDSEWDRSDLLACNSIIVREVGVAVKQYCPGAFLICITNPLDCMAKVLHESSGVPNNMICGMAGVLDSARFRSFVAEKLQVAPCDVHALVIGAHGEAMFPIPRYCTVNSIPLCEFVRKGCITHEEIDQIVLRCQNAGKEIVELLGHGSAYSAPAAAALSMAEAYLLDQKRVMPCAVRLSGEYGVYDLYIGVPVVIGGKGIEKIIELELNDAEKQKFDESVAEVRKLVEKLKLVEEYQAAA